MVKGLGLHSTYGTVREGHVGQKFINLQAVVENMFTGQTS
jgi:hypothetical protein